MTPTISVIVPTQGKPTLERMLDSVRDQLLPGDEVIVVVDTFEMPHHEFQDIRQRAESYGPGFMAFPHDAGHHDWGHSQINYGLTLAEGDYIHANDDDDIYLPGALAVMREAIVAHPGRVFLFRFRSYLGGMVFWLQPGLVRQGCIGGHCLLQPNLPGKCGQWGAHYEGDYTGIVDTLSRHEEPPVWVDHVIACQRPRAEEVAA